MRQALRALTSGKLGPQMHPVMNLADLQKLTDWLSDGARSAPGPTRMMSETCERLVAAGLPLWRVNVFIRTLHPDIFGLSFVWRPGEEVKVTSASFDAPDSQEFKSSPLPDLSQTASEVKHRLDRPHAAHVRF